MVVGGGCQLSFYRENLRKRLKHKGKELYKFNVIKITFILLAESSFYCLTGSAGARRTGKGGGP